MRRNFPVALLCTLLALPAAFAQQGVSGHPGGVSGPTPGGFSGHRFSGGFSGPRVGGGFGGGSVAPQFVHSPGQIPGFAPHAFNANPGRIPVGSNRDFSGWGAGQGNTAFDQSRLQYRSPYRNGGKGWNGNGHRDRDRADHHDHHGYGNSYFGAYPYPYVWANSWQLLPYGLDFSDFSDSNQLDNNEVPQQYSETAQPQGDAQPEPEAPSANGYRPEYEGAETATPPPPPADPVPSAAIAPEPDAIAPEPELTLIYKDGHQQPIHNYVLTSNSVIVLDEAATGRQLRIPLAELNLPATKHAAEEAGLDFTPPA